jgi:NADP-dependent 3-hydroxy acid dehydrogenase YdfG
LDLKIACVNPALVSTELGRRPTSEEGLTALSAALQIPPSDIGVAVNYIIESPPSSTPVTIDLINVAPGFSAKL